MPRSHIQPPLPHWRASLAVLLLLGLLVRYYQVIDGAASQAALRHEATTLHNHALSRCRTLQDRRLRDRCLQELKATADTIAELAARRQLTDVALQRLGP